MSYQGRAIPHGDAALHVTGAARFVDDIPPAGGELAVAFAGSPVPCGAIVSLDGEAARQSFGVAAVLTHRDIPGRNGFPDDPLLAADRVAYLHQPVALVAATSRTLARAACDRIRCAIDEQPPVATIEEAIRRESFHGTPLYIARGNFAQAWADSECRLEGVLHIGGQDHYYLETQAAIAYPEEAGRIRLLSSTQDPTQVQEAVAALLDLGVNDVEVETPRLGGGFGGKETQAAPAAMMAALVAFRTRRPARIVYSRREDSRVTGKRLAYRSAWKASFDRDGMIRCLRVEFHSNGGAAEDLSEGVMQRSLLHAENAYFIPHVELLGRVCRTNLAPNTAFRGFGGPQAIATIEAVIEEIAAALGIDGAVVRRRNCYGGTGRNTTPYGQVVECNRLPEILTRLTESSAYEERRAEIQRLNETSRVLVRAISLVPVKFGISFTTTSLNQGSALVNVYGDGTVQVSTAATEMGQGVNTKIRQAVADALGIALEGVRMMAVSTGKTCNTSPTAASVSADLNGAAAVQAASNIRQRLLALVSHEEDADRVPFAELVARARAQRVDLGARGFYATPGIGFDWQNGRGRPYYYFTTGAAVAEVAIDRFTGETRVLRMDILMDIGKSMNPGIDRGQVIGGFIQGMGWVTTEELRYDGARLLTDSFGSYRIPCAADVPRDLRLEFLERGEMPANFYGAKGVGEPPLLLAIAVWTAIRKAAGWLNPEGARGLALPATPERVLMALLPQR